MADWIHLPCEASSALFRSMRLFSESCFSFSRCFSNQRARSIGPRPIIAEGRWVGIFCSSQSVIPESAGVPCSSFSNALSIAENKSYWINICFIIRSTYLTGRLLLEPHVHHCEIRFPYVWLSWVFFKFSLRLSFQKAEKKWLILVQIVLRPRSSSSFFASLTSRPASFYSYKMANGARFAYFCGILIAAHLAAAFWCPIADCDEVFNYWEPLHHLLYGHGLQTWEYAPRYVFLLQLFVDFRSQPATTLMPLI